MIGNLFQSIGIVLVIVIFTITTIAALYVSYVLAIGVLICALIFVVYHMLSMAKSQKSTPLSEKV
jgi:glucose uptake protein GlcU